MIVNNFVWQQLPDSISQFANISGIELSKFVSSESVDWLKFSNEQFAGDKLREHTAQEVSTIFSALVDLYGDSLSLKFILGERTLLDIKSRPSAEKIQDLFQRLASNNLRLDFDLDKRDLLERIYPLENHPHTIIKLFLFPERLKNALLTPLDQLEDKNELWHKIDNQSRLVILVPQHEIMLTGDYLAILGGSALEELEGHLATQDSLPANLASQMLEKVLAPNSPVKWVHFKLKYLTPLHFYAKGTADFNDEIARALYSQLVKISIIYSADRTKGHTTEAGTLSEWHSTFIEQNESAEVIWDNSTCIPEHKSSKWSDPLAWMEIIMFAYRDEIYASDRLRIIQSVVARKLNESQPTGNFAEIVSQAPELKKRIENLWKIFIEGKIKEYFGQLRDIEQAVETASEKIQNQFDALTRSVFDNALTAVGVLIGIFIASVFRDKFNVGLFWTGTIVYLIYLLIFPHWIGLMLSRERFDNTVAAFEKRKQNFSRRLSEIVINEIIGDVVGDWKKYYKKWHNRARYLYQGVALAIILAAIAVTYFASTESISSSKSVESVSTAISQTPPTLSTKKPGETPSPTITLTKVPTLRSTYTPQP